MADAGDGPRRSVVGRACGAALAAVMLAGCASPRPPGPADGLLGQVQAWGPPDAPVAAHWLLPADRSDAGSRLLVLQHGFLRQCRHLAGLRAALALGGWAVLCLDLPQAAGDAALAEDLAAALVQGPLWPPGTSSPPARVVVGGFSAGAVFAVRLGEALHRAAPERLAGALLLDPVDTRGFGPALATVSQHGQRPWLALLANPGPCNAEGSAVAPLLAVAEAMAEREASATAIVRLLRGSTHVDAEGEDTSDLAVRACGQGPPRPDNVAALRELSAAWLAGVERPARLLPRGAIRSATGASTAFAAAAARHEAAGALVWLAGGGRESQGAFGRP